jgi:adenosylcobinamide kinase/adenosylcobinamide-phosphate guanylyltransferase
MNLLPNLTLIIGGACSGKTKFAENLTLNNGLNNLYIATAEPFDKEMKSKIDLHQKSRALQKWKTIEAFHNLAETLEGMKEVKFDTILIDCLTMWLTNKFLKNKDLTQEFSRLVESVREQKMKLVIVTNELGYGIVPDNKMAREFRNLNGQLNQQIAAEADLVIQVVAGLPCTLKGTLPKVSNDY